MSYKKKIDKLTRENHFVYITGVFYFHFDIGLELNSYVFFAVIQYYICTYTYIQRYICTYSLLKLLIIKCIIDKRNL
ncbi:hypothetical protein B5P42_28970 [Bacillus sp. SRB_331]|nr:hypothetical protein B5P42_28970 [Bacillus sp. SRB_331]